MSTFGDLVKRLRKEQDLTLEQVARKIGSHKGYVSGIENGKVNPPSVKFIRKFARLFRFDEKQMIRMSYVDKAPQAIRDEVRRVLDGAAGPAASPAPAAGGLPLVNTLATGYPTEIDAQGLPKALSRETLSLSGLHGRAKFAATVCDNSMEAPDSPLSLGRGDIVFLAPESKLKHGDLVLAVFTAKERRQALIRQVMLEQNEHIILQPLNKEFPLQFLTHDDLEATYRVVARLELFEPATMKSTA